MSEHRGLLATEQRVPPAARSPALPAAAAFITGVLLDEWVGPALLVWLALALVAWAAWLVGFWRRRDRTAIVLLLFCCACAGGARHHQFLSIRRGDDIALLATEDGTPVRIIGTLADQPAIRGRSQDPLAAAWPRVDQSVCTLRCDAIIAGEETLPVSGQARLTVEGHLLHATVGDRVEVRGWLFRPRGPRNPGEFDYRQYLRRQGTDCVVFAGHPDAVRRLRSGDSRSLPRTVAAARERTQDLMVSHLSDDTRPVATALLVGDRSELTDKTQTAFVESGMMHVMAISGMNVAILAGFVLVLCRGLNVSQTATCLAVMLIVLGYALFAEARPPILRATVFIVAVFAGRPWYRQASVVNGLALAALVVLVWRPTDLFDIGAQLSFLAVAGIAWGEEWDRRWAASRDGDLFVERSALSRWWREAGARLRQGQFMMAAIWLLTAPLIASQFHLVSPVGLALNIVLAPLVVAMLWLGYAFLLCGWILPPLAGPFGRGFDVLLGLMLRSVDAAAAWDMGHGYCPAPPAWWLVAYYLLMTMAFGLRHRRGHGRWIVAGVLAWTALGLGLGLRQEPSGGLRCTFLDVGHGCAVLVETPENRTLLCDAGSLTNGPRAGRVVQSALWERGHWRIDALVVSHADLDHFNAVPTLVETLPVGGLCIARASVGETQEGMRTVTDTAASRNVPISLLAAGDRIALDPAVVITVLHPAEGEVSSHDNANSIVLQIEYAGRRILLTGDVERDGLERLLSLPERPVDVLMAPHHGSRAANPWRLAAWSNPKIVVVSAGQNRRTAFLQDVYGEEVAIWSTAESGAVTIEIASDGTMRATGCAGR